MFAAPFLKATFSYLHAQKAPGHEICKSPAGQQSWAGSSVFKDSTALPILQSAQHKHTSGYGITYLVRCDKAGGNLIENNTALRMKRSPFSC